MTTRVHENGVFKNFHSGERFQKIAIDALPRKTDHVWTGSEALWKSRNEQPGSTTLIHGRESGNP